MKASFRVERQKLALCVRFSKDCVFLRKIVQSRIQFWLVGLGFCDFALSCVNCLCITLVGSGGLCIFFFVFVSPWLEEACPQQVHKPLLCHCASPGVER